MRLIFLLFIGCFVFIGCSSPYSVTSSDFFAKEVVKANSEIIEMGYQLSGTETNTKNNLYVKGTSYTPVSGYGTAMGNDFVAIDKYKFTDSKGNTMSYTVSYKLIEEEDVDVISVWNVGIQQCETSNPQDYMRLCGSDSPIKKLTNLPKNIDVGYSEVNSPYSWLIVSGILIAIGGALLITL